MLKHKIESICRRGKMKPVRRAKINGTDIFIADGFSATPHITYRKFGIEKGDFPFGCYATLWWVSNDGEKLNTGQPLFFDAFHNKRYAMGSKQLARINTAMKSARAFLNSRKKVSNGLAN